MKNVLVLAPQFPAANQPWIDTYLEKLLVNGLEVSILSTNNEIGPYSSKVDSLRLRDRVLPISLGPLDVLRGALGSLLKFRLADIRSALNVASHFSGGVASFLSALVYALYFQDCEFGEIALIHSHDEILAYRFLLLARLRKVPLVLTFHGMPPSDVRQLSAEKRNALYRELSAVFVNTGFSRQQVVNLGCPAEKIIVLPQGLCIEDFPFFVRSAPGSGEVLRVLTVGRYHRDKGQAYALVALARLLRAGVSVEWTFVGVGLYLPRLQRLAARLGVERNVRFLTELPQDEVKPLYQACHLFVLPSVAAETQGVVLQEAQASGCIPVATCVGGISECVANGKDAFLVRPRSSRQITHTVLALLSDPDIWLTVQQTGRQRVEQLFSADVIGKRMAIELRRLCSDFQEARSVRPR
jgi:glycosyltransferase involved in cell wall biosynthesis